MVTRIPINASWPAKTVPGVSELIAGDSRHLLLRGNCLRLMAAMPPEFVDCVVTSPPYWKMREYDVNGAEAADMIGGENSPDEYVQNLAAVFDQCRRLLSEQGSLWLNLGDKYVGKNLMGMPWRVALEMQKRGWILRNAVIWDQMKGTQSVKDRMRDCYEHVFHFVKSRRYHFAADEILIPPKAAPTTVNGKAVSATGVCGVRYRQQIESSDLLANGEKRAALNALDDAIRQMRDGEIVDFRMTIRGRQRTYHSDSRKISGRAKELADKGFFIMKIGSRGFLPTDIWRIVPEDKFREDGHYAVFPENLLQRPLKATCPKGGVVLDPFSGTGSAVAAALSLGRRGVGIELSAVYHKTAQKRLRRLSALF